MEWIPEQCRNVHIVYGYLSHRRTQEKHRMTGRIQIRILSQHIFGLSKRSWDVDDLLTDCWNWWWFSRGPYPIVIPLVMSTSGHLYHDFVYVFFLVGNSCFFVLVPSHIYKTSVCLLRNTNNNNDKTRTKHEIFGNWKKFICIRIKKGESRGLKVSHSNYDE
jgi:hypothetical protein